MGHIKGCINEGGDAPSVVAFIQPEPPDTMATSSRTASTLQNLLDQDPFEMESDEREALYQDLKDTMEEHYQSVTSRALRRRRHRIQKRREAGTKTVHGRTFEDDHHTSHADREEEKMQEDVKTYFGGGDDVGAQRFKHILAILTGRYDRRFWGEDRSGVKDLNDSKVGTLKGEAILTRAREQGYSVQLVRTWADHEAGEVKRERGEMLA